MSAPPAAAAAAEAPALPVSSLSVDSPGASAASGGAGGSPGVPAGAAAAPSGALPPPPVFSFSAFASAYSLPFATPAEIAAAEDADEEGLEDSALVPEGELKMVCLVRSDLNMSKGKIAAQTGHAFLGAYRLAQRLELPREWAKAWLFRAQAKITLRVETEAAMDAIAEAARAVGLPTLAIADAGRTEVEPGTRTVLAIGPGPKELIDSITGPKGSHALKLLV